MFQTNDAALMIPAVELTVNWSQVIAADGVATLPVDAISTLAARMANHSSAKFETFARTTFTEGPLIIDLSEPLTLTTRFVHRTAESTLTNVTGRLAKHPSYKNQRDFAGLRHGGLWWESLLGQCLASAVRAELLRRIAAANQGVAGRATKAQSEYDRLVLQSQDVCFMPTSFVKMIDSRLITTTRALSWPDKSTLVLLDTTPIRESVLDALVASRPVAERDLVKDAIRDDLTGVADGLRNGVDLAAVTTRVLSPAETEALRNNAGALFALPLLVMSTIGEMNSVMSIPAFLDTLLSVYKSIPDSADFVVDVENSPRTVAELLQSATGVADRAFLNGLDEFYRRRRVPPIPAGTSASVADQIISLHPLLIPNCTITGRRTAQVQDGSSVCQLVYPDPDGLDYSLTTGSGASDARLELQRFHAFQNSCAALLLSRAKVAPEVLRDYGISDVQRGNIFALL